MNERQRRQLDELHQDRADLMAAATRIRECRGTWAGLADDRYGLPSIELLHLLAAELDRLPWQIRGPIVRISRQLAGAPMDDPVTRRTRRR